MPLNATTAPPRWNAHRSPRLVRVAVSLAGLAAAAALSMQGSAWSQEATAIQQLQPPGAAPPGEATSDPITNEQIELLEQTGLIAKQSQLNEGLLLMQRQLQQAELVGQLLTVLGPMAEIEVTPGQFQRFNDTPAGLREQIAYMQLQIDLQNKEKELGVFQSNGEAVITEIYGKTNDYTAVVKVGEQSETVVAGDQLADGSEVLSITPDEIRMQAKDGTIKVLNAP